MKKHPKNPQNKSEKPLPALPIHTPVISPFQSLHKILKSSWARAVAVVTFFLTIASLYEGYLFLLPDIHPNGQSSDASSYTLPFSIKNRSHYVALTDISLHCEYSIVTWDLRNEKTDLTHFRAQGIMTTASKQNDIRINPGESVNFPCDASDAIKASIEGHALPIVEIRMRINVSYHARVKFLSVPRAYSSPVFIWKKAASGFQWFEGDFVQ